MKIFLAGENQKKHIIPLIHKNNMKLFGGDREQHWLLEEMI